MEGAPGWAGRILLADLDRGEARCIPTSDYAAQALGGRSLGAALAWDLVRPGMDAFDPGNPLMFLSGPLAGSMAPSAGRITVCALSPQCYPKPWFSRSSMGGDLGHQLKAAGYDGVVVIGRAPRPVYLCITTQGASIEDAEGLWGLGIMATQATLQGRHGARAQVAAVGQAGENLSRIASIGVNEGSAAGQGGFGAVMGSKNLKAVVAYGEQRTRMAHPEECRAFLRAMAQEYVADRERRSRLQGLAGRPPGRRAPCGRGCLFPCATRYEGVRGTIHPDRAYAGVAQCASFRYGGSRDGFWNLGFDAGFELNMLANDWGINHWDVLKGLYVWLAMCRRDGLLAEIGGRAVDPDDPRFWYDVLAAIATRSGPLAEVVADGGRRAIALTGLMPEDARQLYTGWGYANHWDGRGPRGNTINYPFWLVSALMWISDTRDPMGGAHGYAQNMTNASPFTQKVISWEGLQALGERYFGGPAAMDPLSDGEGKAEAAIFSLRRSVLKDSLIVCDRVFPRLFTSLTEDGMPRILGVAGPDCEAELLRLVTGWELATADLDRIADRTLALERAQQARDLGRTRQDEQHVMDYFCATLEEKPNPLLGERRSADPALLEDLVRRFYALRGWDPLTGLPTKETLTALGLDATVPAPPVGEGAGPACPPAG